MVKYLSKFVLEVLPSLVATIVGAYIVAHYINPRPETPKAAVVATAPTGEAKNAADTTGTVEDKADAKSSDTKPTDTNPAEGRKGEGRGQGQARPTPTRRPTRRRVPSSWPAPPSSACAGPRSMRLRRPRSLFVRQSRPCGTDESARVAVQTSPQRTQMAAAPAVAPVPQPAPVAATAPPPLPPPVIVASPYGRHSVGPEAPAPAVDRPTDQVNADRPTPPADIPAQRDGFDLQPQSTPVEHVSIADHVLSTTKSFFRALTPNSQSDFSQSASASPTDGVTPKQKRGLLGPRFFIPLLQRLSADRAVRRQIHHRHQGHRDRRRPGHRGRHVCRSSASSATGLHAAASCGPACARGGRPRPSRGPSFGGLLVVAAELHLAENTLALHLLLERLEGLVDIVVANENLHEASFIGWRLDRSKVREFGSRWWPAKALNQRQARGCTRIKPGMSTRYRRGRMLVWRH